jgi:hypothetical protein
MPQPIADLLRELHRRLRDPGPEVAPRSAQGTDERAPASEPSTTGQKGVVPMRGRRDIER